MTAPPKLHFEMQSNPEHIEPIRLKCEELARQIGFDEKSAGEIGLVVNEAIANVIEHAYDFARGSPILVQAEAIEGGIKIKIRDWGPGVDPSKLPVKEKDPLVPGGLGLICMREMMDNVEYAPQPDGGMLLTMTRML